VTSLDREPDHSLGITEVRRRAAELDLALKQQELELRLREQNNRDSEVTLKQAEAQASKWRSPLVVAVLAAAAAGMSNAAVSIVNARNEQALEESRAESSRILEAIKTGDTEKAAQNLEFLLKAGLLTEKRANGIRAYLKSRQPGTGAALPTASGRFRIEGAQGLSTPAQQELNTRLNLYIAYLGEIGFKSASTGSVAIQFEKQEGLNAYYNPDEGGIKISPELATDPFVALWAYTEYALHNESGHLPISPEGDAIAKGLSDYYAASFLDDPLVGKGYAAAAKMNQPYLRRLDNGFSYDEVATGRRAEPTSVGEVWSGVFWEMRAKIGRSETDRLLLATWRAAAAREGAGALGAEFVRACQTIASTSLDPRKAKLVVAILAKRGFIPYPNVPKELTAPFSQIDDSATTNAPRHEGWD
jgi:hypothetical protein